MERKGEKQTFLHIYLEYIHKSITFAPAKQKKSHHEPDVTHIEQDLPDDPPAQGYGQPADGARPLVQRVHLSTLLPSSLSASHEAASKIEKSNVILNAVKDLNTQTTDFKILHYVQNDKMLAFFHF